MIVASVNAMSETFLARHHRPPSGNSNPPSSIESRSRRRHESSTATLATTKEEPTPLTLPESITTPIETISARAATLRFADVAPPSVQLLKHRSRSISTVFNFDQDDAKADREAQRQRVIQTTLSRGVSLSKRQSLADGKFRRHDIAPSQQQHSFVAEAADDLDSVFEKSDKLADKYRRKLS